MIAIAIALWVALCAVSTWLYAERQAHADTRRERDDLRRENVGLRWELHRERSRDTTADTVDQWLRERVVR